MRKDAALHDAETGMAVPRAGTQPSSAAPSASTAPAMFRSRLCVAGKAGHSSSTIWMSEPSRPWISIARSGERKCSRAVDMRAEAHAFFRDLAQLRQRHHLEAAGIGEDRAVPRHEFVQAAQPARCARRPAAASDDRCCRAGYRRPSRARDAGSIALTVAAVPTGMNAGVRIAPRGVAISPVRAAPSRAAIENAKALMPLIEARSNQKTGIAIGIEAIALAQSPRHRRGASCRAP